MEIHAITKLYNATFEGDEHLLRNLLQEDPLILERCIAEKSRYYTQTPLHVAANLGHLHIVNILLEMKPNMCFVLDQDGMTPVHVAAINGRIDVLEMLYDKIPDAIRERTNGGETVLHLCIKHNNMEVLMFLSYRVDVIPDAIRERTNDGETVLHFCIKHNKMEVLKILLDHVDAIPHAIRERTIGGETVLHLCIKHNKMEALKVLLAHHVDAELLNSKDNDGNTILHLAVIGKQYEMVEELLNHEKHKLIELNAINKNGMTAMDNSLFLTEGYQSYRDVMKNNILFTTRKEGDSIGPLLEKSNALRVKDVIKQKNRDSWVENQSNALMVVASLIATMAFQVGVNPPGGVWEDDGMHKDGFSPSPMQHIAGDAVKDSYDRYDRHLFRVFVASNTLALVFSLSVILLLISGLPRGRLFVVILRIAMWISITATTATYTFSLVLTTWSTSDGTDASIIALRYWLGMIAIMVAAHALLFVIKVIIKIPALRELCFKIWRPVQKNPSSQCLINRC